MAQAVQQRPHQGGFPRPQVAFQPDHGARFEERPQAFTQAPGGGLVDEGENGGTIGAMQDRDSNTDYGALAAAIKARGRELGFAAVGIPRAEPLVKNSTASSLATMVGMNAYGSTNG